MKGRNPVPVRALRDDPTLQRARAHNRSRCRLGNRLLVRPHLNHWPGPPGRTAADRCHLPSPVRRSWPLPAHKWSRSTVCSPIHNPGSCARLTGRSHVRGTHRSSRRRRARSSTHNLSRVRGHSARSGSFAPDGFPSRCCCVHILSTHSRSPSLRISGRNGPAISAGQGTLCRLPL